MAVYNLKAALMFNSMIDHQINEVQISTDYGQNELPGHSADSRVIKNILDSGNDVLRFVNQHHFLVRESGDLSDA